MIIVEILNIPALDVHGLALLSSIPPYCTVNQAGVLPGATATVSSMTVRTAVFLHSILVALAILSILLADT